MNLFLDTSSLIKLYHEEPDTHNLDEIFRTQRVATVFLSDISKLEFASAFWKKVRIGEIKMSLALQIIQLFRQDYRKYTFIPVDTDTIQAACLLLDKYGSSGLRALDSIQLATATRLVSKAQLFKTGDKLLESFLRAESLPV
ncbi:type II toxin-antitoxin system VapC family toxin [Dyadobacter bucti]|uniref:type II toxin-antitoxin system VapC family toxin n=1 Tax=Dyadobacter bucti TaxID=2572203 RepID=UPI003F72905F